MKEGMLRKEGRNINEGRKEYQGRREGMLMKEGRNIKEGGKAY